MGAAQASPRRGDHDEESSDDREIEGISEETEHTRAELSGTIDAIHARLAPQHLIEQAKGAARHASTSFVAEKKSALLDATVSGVEQFVGKAGRIVNDYEYSAREASDSVIDTIKHNPVPAAVTAFGIAWLMSRRRQRHAPQPHSPDSWMYSEHAYEDHGRFHERAELGIRERAGHIAERASDVLESARETVGGIATTAGGVAGEATDPAGRIAGTASDRAVSVASTASSTAVDVGSGFWDTIRRNPVPAAVTGLGIAWMLMNREETRFRPMEAVSNVSENVPVPPVGELTNRAKCQVGDLSSGAQGQLESLLENSPLALGAIAMGLGAAVGMLLPPTPREREILGGVSEALVGRTRRSRRRRSSGSSTSPSR